MPSISRRSLLGAMGAAALATPALLEPAHAAPKPKALRHTLSNECYSLRDAIHAGKVTLETIGEFHKNTLGIRGISLNDMFFKSYEKSYLDPILANIKANDRIVTAYIVEGNLATKDEAARKMQIAGNLTRLKAAAYLGAPTVRLNLGGVGPGEDDLKEGVDRCVAAFKEILPVAQDLGIRICIENHGGVSGTVDGVLAVVHQTDPKWVGSLLDFGNHPVDHNPEVFAKLAPYAFHTHAKLQSFKPDGEATNSDYGALLDILKHVNYKGAVSSEWEGQGEAIEGVKKTRDLILKHWPELPN